MWLWGWSHGIELKRNFKEHFQSYRTVCNNIIFNWKQLIKMDFFLRSLPKSRNVSWKWKFGGLTFHFYLSWGGGGGGCVCWGCPSVNEPSGTTASLRPWCLALVFWSDPSPLEFLSPRTRCSKQTTEKSTAPSWKWTVATLPLSVYLNNINFLSATGLRRSWAV